MDRVLHWPVHPLFHRDWEEGGREGAQVFLPLFGAGEVINKTGFCLTSTGPM